MADWKMEKIDRIWFRTRMPLQALAEKLLLTDVTRDCENVWEWVIGKLGNVSIDICREHASARMKVDTILFEIDNRPLSPSTVETLIERLLPLVASSIVIGRGEKPGQSEVRVHEFSVIDAGLSQRGLG